MQIVSADTIALLTVEITLPNRVWEVLVYMSGGSWPVTWIRLFWIGRPLVWNSTTCECWEQLNPIEGTWMCVDSSFGWWDNSIWGVAGWCGGKWWFQVWVVGNYPHPNKRLGGMNPPPKKLSKFFSAHTHTHTYTHHIPPLVKSSAPPL